MGRPIGLEITDKSGWRKEFPLEKNIVHIGSDAHNDIVLDSWRGTGIDRRHIQLIRLPGQGYRLINMGTTDIWYGPGGGQSLGSLSSIELSDGLTFKVGDFAFVVHGGDAPAMGAISTSTSTSAEAAGAGAIGLSLHLPPTLIKPDRAVDGSITVRNLGEKSGVQFKLEVEGLETDAYEIGPGPILFPNGEKEVFFRIRHPRRPNPPAGDRLFTIRVTAPGAYAGEGAAVSQTIQIAPFFSHEMSLTLTD